MAFYRNDKKFEVNGGDGWTERILEIISDPKIYDGGNDTFKFNKNEIFSVRVYKPGKWINVVSKEKWWDSERDLKLYLKMSSIYTGEVVSVVESGEAVKINIEVKRGRFEDRGGKYEEFYDIEEWDPDPNNFRSKHKFRAIKTTEFPEDFFDKVYEVKMEISKREIRTCSTSGEINSEPWWEKWDQS